MGPGTKVQGGWLRTLPREGEGGGWPAGSPGGCSSLKENPKIRLLRISRRCWRALNPKHRAPSGHGAPRNSPGHMPRTLVP